MNSSVFWDLTPCSHQRFGGTCHLHLQGRRISQARNQHESRRQGDFQWTTQRYIQEQRTLHSTAVRTSYPK
jgi:hypothetical protein